MSLYREHNDESSFIDMNYDDDTHDLSHKKHVRKLLEDRLDRKRLKKELEYFDGELDGEFNWDYIEK